MQLVYATGYREREFQIAESRTEVPSGARVYATCTKEKAVEDVGEVTFQGMSEDEYYSLKAMVRAARERAPRSSRRAPRLRRCARSTGDSSAGKGGARRASRG